MAVVARVGWRARAQVACYSITERHASAVVETWHQVARTELRVALSACEKRLARAQERAVNVIAGATVVARRRQAHFVVLAVDARVAVGAHAARLEALRLVEARAVVLARAAGAE